MKFSILALFNIQALQFSYLHNSVQPFRFFYILDKVASSAKTRSFQIGRLCALRAPSKQLEQSS